MNDVLGNFVKKVVQLPVVMLTVLYDLVEKLSGEAGQQWLMELKKFLRKENCWIGVEAKEAILKLISNDCRLIINAADGKEILADAHDVFDEIDESFGGCDADETGAATEETAVDVYELERDANFAQIAAFVSSDEKRLCFTQAQIKGFVNKHRVWLRKCDTGTFLFFKSYGKYYVADVSRLHDGRLKCSVNRFASSVVWRAEYHFRVVVPKLT